MYWVANPQPCFDADTYMVRVLLPAILQPCAMDGCSLRFRQDFRNLKHLFGVGERHRSHSRAQALQGLSGFHQRSPNLGINLPECFVRRNTDAQAFQPRWDQEIFDRRQLVRAAGCIHRIIAGDHLEQDGAVAGRPCDWTDMIEAPRARKDAMATDAAVRRLRPVTPFAAAGSRMEAPVSVPSAPNASRAARQPPNHSTTRPLCMFDRRRCGNRRNAHYARWDQPRIPTC